MYFPKYILTYSVRALTLIISFVFLSACSGSASENSATAAAQGCTGSGTATETYTISWNQITDNSGLIDGFKVYFGSNTLITKQNSAGDFSVSGTAAENSWPFTPSSYGLQKCTTYNFAVASLNNLEESQLSETVSILIE